MTFERFSFDRRIVAGIRACGYETPTAIQSKAISPVLEGRDVVGLAQTGTGKTAAFALPILQRLLDADAAKTGPARVLVLAPTRELALQIHETFFSLGKETGIRSAAVFGGVGVMPQVKALRRATVVVACPGRLLDLIQRGDAQLGDVDVLVLDEADRMLDMGFMPDIRRIVAKIRAKRQTLLFSATMPPEIRDLAKGMLHDPITVQVDNTRPAESISHSLYPVLQHQKTQFLQAILDRDEHDAALVFTRTKHKAKSLAQVLDRRGYNATFIQGNLSQSRRQQALDGFKCGKYRIMVATDIAARGIDCSSITHVINFDVPDTAETYTHRIGRTGRAGRTGEALTFCTPDDAQMVRDIEKVLGKSIERRTLGGFEYDAQSPERPEPVEAREGDRSRSGRGRGGNARPGRSRSDSSRGAGNAKPAGSVGSGRGGKSPAKSVAGTKASAPAKAESASNRASRDDAAGNGQKPDRRRRRGGRGRGKGPQASAAN